CFICAVVFVAPSSPAFYPLSLHDALPISTASPRARATSIAETVRRRTPIRPETPRSRRVRVAYPKSRSGRSAEGCGSRRCSSPRSEEHTSELQSRFDLVCRLLLENKKRQK